MSRIVLVRHGRSAHAQRGWHDAAALARWFDAYDAAGLAPADRPPAPLCAAVARAGLVVASDMPRARESAALLAPGREVAASPLLREIPIAAPALGRLRLPLMGWALAVGARAAYRRLRGAPSPAEAVARGEAAAAWLRELAGAHGVVVAVTHANLRAYAAAALVAGGWRREPGGRRYAHWSAWTFADDGA